MSIESLRLEGERAPNGVMSLPLWVFLDDSAQEPRASGETAGVKGNRSLREWTLIFGG